MASRATSLHSIHQVLVMNQSQKVQKQSKNIEQLLPHIPTGYRPWIRWHSKSDSVRSCDSMELGTIRMDGTHPIRTWHREDGCQIPDLNPMAMLW